MTIVSNVFVLLFVGILVSLLRAYIIVDVIDLFNIPHAYVFTVPHVWALLSILMIIQSTSSKVKEESWEETLARLWLKIIEAVLGVLFVWGIVYIVHYFLL